jgi:glycosyltransferase involved in cell wall biosynthesis
MRIMIVTDQYPPMIGGVPTVTHNLAQDFANRGHQVWVVAPSQGSRDLRRTEQKVRVYRFSSFEWPTYEGLRIPYLPFVPIRNLLKKSDPDIIHVHSPVVLGNIAQILGGGLHKPVIATNHYLPINWSRSLSSDPFIGKHFSNISFSYLVSFCNRCEYVTAPTNTALNLLYEHGLHAPARAISNGIDLQRFSPAPRNEELRQRLKLPNDRPIILSLNRLSEEKRVNVLIDAFSKLQNNAHLAIASTGPAEADLRAQVAQLGLEDRISFLGFVRDNDLADLYRLADIFAVPSEAELQSITTMEAMGCGIPVVAADSYALPELVHHNENGFLFTPSNSDEMARYLDTLLTEKELHQQMSAKGLEIIAHHDKNKVLDQWESLYRRLALEFVEAKQRKLQLKLDRRRKETSRRNKKSPERQPRRLRTGELFLDQK